MVESRFRSMIEVSADLGSGCNQNRPDASTVTPHDKPEIRTSALSSRALRGRQSVIVDRAGGGNDSNNPQGLDGGLQKALITERYSK